MLQPTLSLARPPVCLSRFAHTHLVRGGSLMLQPTEILTQLDFSLPIL